MILGYKKAVLASLWDLRCCQQEGGRPKARQKRGQGGLSEFGRVRGVAQSIISETVFDNSGIFAAVGTTFS